MSTDINVADGKKPSQSNPDKLTEKAIADFHETMHAIAVMAETQLKHATENKERELAELQARLSGIHEQMVGQRLNAYDAGSHINSAIECTKSLQLLESFPQEVMLAETIFTSIFSSFDGYLYHLLHNLYSRKPKLLVHSDDKMVHVNQVLDCSRSDIIDSLIDGEIDSLLRDSYIKLFEKLANRFEVGTLKRFANWPKFVECSQRRNVITHCGGIVSKQYIGICKAEGISAAELPQIGQKLTVSREYLVESINVVTEVGYKLGQILWRSLGPESMFAADENLGQTMYELLKREEWSMALRFGELGEECSKRDHRPPRKERSVKIILINHAQAAKWSGDAKTAMHILDNSDWSGSALEYQLSVACLREEWDQAASIMKAIGPFSAAVPVFAYMGWPIFREFRATTEFSTMFHEVYGVEFTDEMQRVKDEDEPPQLVQNLTENTEMPIDPTTR